MATPIVDKDAPPPADMVSEIEATLKSMGVDTTGETSGSPKPEAPAAPAEELEEETDGSKAPDAEPEEKVENPESTEGEEGEDGEKAVEKTPEAGKTQDSGAKVEPQVEKPAEKAVEKPAVTSSLTNSEFSSNIFNELNDGVLIIVISKSSSEISTLEPPPKR